MGNCLAPFALKKKTAPDGSTITVPCGRCPECKRRRIAGWTVRLLQEDRTCVSAVFLTLTYDTDHVPITKNRLLSVNKKHVQDYFKQLRTLEQRNICRIEKCKIGRKKTVHSETCKATIQPKIKYYACAEYGGKRKRPHYHVILFNVQKDTHYQEAWPHGGIHLDQVNGATICYSLKYMDKPTLIPQFKKDDREPEFSLMSKGLGANYLTSRNINWHTTNIMERVYMPLDNYKVSMPRYYKDRIYQLFEDRTPDGMGGFHSHNPIRQAVGQISQQKAEQRKREILTAQLVTKSMEQIIHEKIESDKAALTKFHNNHFNDSF